MSKMTCSDAERLMPQYVLGQLDDSDAEGLLSHLFACQSCYQYHWKPYYLSAMQQVDVFVDALAEETFSADSRGDGTLSEAGTWVGGEGEDGRLEPPIPLGEAGLLEASGGAQEDLAGLPGLQRIGRLLPECPEGFSAYRLYLGRGEPALEPTLEAHVCLRVSRQGEAVQLSLEASERGAQLDGRSLIPRRRVALERAHVLRAGNAVYLLEVAPKTRWPWPGVGMVRYSGPFFPLRQQVMGVGRRLETPGISLPDRMVQSNLEADDAYVPPPGERSSPFYFDRYNVSRRHAEVTRAGLWVKVAALAPISVREGEVVTRLKRGDAPVVLRDRSELLIGQDLFRVRAQTG